MTPGVVERAWRRYVTETWTQAEQRRARHDADVPPGRADRDVVVILLTAAVSLTLVNFGKDAANPVWLTTPLDLAGLGGVADAIERAVAGPERSELGRLGFWAAVQVAGLVLPAVLVARFVLRRRLGDLGVRVRGTLRHAGVYAAIGAVAIPIVALAATSSAFQAKYPFYALAPGEGVGGGLLAWWVLYALQFAALEFFFRGFLVHGLAPRLGFLAVPVMVVPYTMLHFGKPVAEAFGAIAGGFVLGVLSLRSGSIWWGVALHVAVALTMDLAALGHRGLLW